MKPLGINFGTSTQVLGYAGKAGWITPLWSTDTYKLYICDGNTGTKHEVALKADLSAYATTAAMNSALGGKADTSHTHTTAQVDGLDTALEGKAAATHTHTKSQISDFAHSHPTSGVTGLDTALAGKADSASVIPKANSRGTLAGYETPLVQATALSVTNATNDSSCVTGAVAITVNNGESGQSWTKTVALTNASATVTLGTAWKWVGGSAPTISANCVLVLHWCNSFGIANLVASS